jgi:phosphatidylglycerol:prolipoprotein diacylglycerol transferase
MQQVLFRIPWIGFPIYGFGLMLFVAFVLCTWLAGRRAEREGIRKEQIQDMAVWVFVGGIIGARLTFLIWQKRSIWEFYRIWDGGLVLYGSVVGGLIGYALAYYFVIRKYGLSTWQLADIVAPSVALGLAVGRIGCLLNGCCYGAVACHDCYQVSYPLASMPWFELVDHGYQTAAGFTIASREPVEVGAVAAGSPADSEAGLRPGDVILRANDQEIKKLEDLDNYLHRPGAEPDLTLTVRRGSKELTLPPYAPRTLGLHPTQIYETISMVLALLLLLAYEPFRRRPGEVSAVLMFCYGIHRYLDELLRADQRPNDLEKYVSVALIVLGLAVWAWRRWLP